MDDKQPAIIERVTLKPGWKTTEFWVSIFTGAAPLMVDALPVTWKAIISVSAGAVYTIARGLAKLGIRGPAR